MSVESKAQFFHAIRNNIDFAFQPIVNIHTGSLFAYEALLRGQSKIGFDEIHDLFDFLHEGGLLYTADTALREIAIEKFARFGNDRGIKLFYNLDNRIINASDYRRGNTERLVRRYGLPINAICFEISERHSVREYAQAGRVLGWYQDQGYSLAIDDFGAGYAGLSLFYEHHPDYVKIDRFFISNLAADHKKKLFVSTIVNLAHALGVQVIAEGVETREEFLASKEIGCDFAQGWFIARAEIDIPKIRTRYEEIEQTAAGDKRTSAGKTTRDRRYIEEQLDAVPAIVLGAGLAEVCDAFRATPNKPCLPVVDDAGRFLGVISETNIRNDMYSPFGRDVLQNKHYGKKLTDFIQNFPVADIGLGMDKILEIMHVSDGTEGVAVLEDSRYLGFLSAISMIRIVNERNLYQAQNQNPLSGLPGHATIIDFVGETIAEEHAGSVLVYFDFDNFKPFNDTYGFRQGDRAISLFTELLKKRFGSNDAFLGHVGGDDFFLGLRRRTFADVAPSIRALMASFREDVESFYSAEARQAGYIELRDRHDAIRRFPLMTVSAAVIELPSGRRNATVDMLAERIAGLKKAAKKSTDGLMTEVVAV